MGPRFFNRGKIERFGRERELGESLQWGRGFSTAESRVGVRRSFWAFPCFNGAAVFQPRKGGETTYGYRRSRASMGPRFFNRGKWSWLHWRPVALGFNGAAVLQPRKDIGVGSTAGRNGRFNGAAVFQPRKGLGIRPQHAERSQLQWGRGFSTAERSTLGAVSVPEAASMGPRFFNRGKPTASSNVRPGCMSVLQWGRGSSTAESMSHSVPDRSTALGFNGAAVFQPRKGALVIRWPQLG